MGLISYLVGLPLAAAFLVPIFGKKIKWAPAALSIAGSFLACAAAALVALLALKYKILVYKVGGWMPPAGIPMVVDGLSAFMLVTVNVVALFIAVYSAGYIKRYTDTWKFYTLFMIMLAGMNGVLVAGDIFNLYVFLEIAAIAGYFLVAFGTGADELEAAFKYAVMGAVASAFILLGIAFLYIHTSTLNMADMSRIIAVNGRGRAVQFAAALFIMGFGMKAALVPFHAWLPYAHSSAPAPVSAMLSGVSIKVLGIYALLRIFFNIFGMDAVALSILTALGVLSMIAGAILAFGQSDIKRLFAYSSISQIGYIALAFGVGTPLSMIGGLFHLFNHSVFKSLLFLNSGAIERLTGTRRIDKISGVAAASPVTGYTCFAAALSISGVPPLGGFWSKLIIILACFQAGRPGLAFVAAAVSMLTIGYYFRALTPALFGPRDAGAMAAPRERLPFGMALAMIALALISIASFYMLVPSAGNVCNLMLKDAASALASADGYAAAVTESLR